MKIIYHNLFSDAMRSYLTPLEWRINDAYARKHDQDLGHFESKFCLFYVNFMIIYILYGELVREPVKSGNAVLGRSCLALH